MTDCSCDCLSALLPDKTRGGLSADACDFLFGAALDYLSTDSYDFFLSTVIDDFLPGVTASLPGVTNAAINASPRLRVTDADFLSSTLVESTPLSFFRL